MELSCKGTKALRDEGINGRSRVSKLAVEQATSPRWRARGIACCKKNSVIPHGGLAAEAEQKPGVRHQTKTVICGHSIMRKLACSWTFSPTWVEACRLMVRRGTETRMDQEGGGCNKRAARWRPRMRT